MRKLRVYVAGPITSSGNLTDNVRNGIQTTGQLMDMGFAPFCPHLSEFINLVSPKTWEQWIEYDKVWLRECDILLRLPGESRGADAEVAFCDGAKIPVVYSIEELVKWRAERSKWPVYT